MNIDRLAAALSDPQVNALKAGALFIRPSANRRTVRALADRDLVTDLGGGFFTIREEGLSALLRFAMSAELRANVLDRVQVGALVDNRDFTMPECDCRGRSGRGGGHAVACRRKAPLLDKTETPDAETVEQAYAEDVDRDVQIEADRGHADAVAVTLARRVLLAETDKERHAEMSLDFYVRFGHVPFPPYTLRHRLYSERLAVALAEFRQIDAPAVEGETVSDTIEVGEGRNGKGTEPTLTVVPSRVTAGLPLYTETREGEEFTHLSIPTWSVTLCGREAPGEHGTADSAALVDCLDCLDKHTASLAA